MKNPRFQKFKNSKLSKLQQFENSNILKIRNAKNNINENANIDNLKQS